MNAALVVVMGVSGCGKSTVGAQLAQALGVGFVEGDDFHPPRNVALMAAGTPLTDADRAGWLETLAQALGAAHAAGRGLVLSCSALKRSYREQLRRGAPGLVFVHLAATPAVLAERVATRAHRYMPASLLASQLATLESPAPDEPAITVDAAVPTERIVQTVLQQLATNAFPPRTRTAMATFTQVILYTDTDGRARFREQPIELSEGTPKAMLSPLAPSGGYQLRQSPVGFRSDFHCTGHPQWLFVLGGTMEIGLQDGTTRVFGPGMHFYSADTLPDGATFDPALHGHCSRQLGDEPLVTLFVRA